MKFKNVALTASLIFFAIGFSDLQANGFFYAGRPLGAVCFMLYLIFTALEKETALFDKEHQHGTMPEKTEKKKESSSETAHRAAVAH